MTQITLKTVPFLGILTTAQAFSSETPQTPPYSKIYLGPQVYSVNTAIRDVSHFHGTLAGASLGYVYTKPNSLYAKAFVSWALGSIRSSGHPSRFLHDETVEGQLGYTWAFKQMQLSPFIGYGFHYLIEHRKKSPEYASLQFSYENYYLPLGITWKYFFYKQCNIGLSISQRYDVSPSVKVSDLKGVSWNLDHTTGTRVSIPIEGVLESKVQWGFCLEPFWQEYQLGKTKAISSLGEPLGITSQTFHQWGGELSLNVWF